MTDNSSFRNGVIVGLLAMVGAQATHWLITPASHPDTGAVRTVGVVIQAILGFGGAIWIATKQRSGRRRWTGTGRTKVW